MQSCKGAQAREKVRGMGDGRKGGEGNELPEGILGTFEWGSWRDLLILTGVKGVR